MTSRRKKLALFAISLLLLISSLIIISNKVTYTSLDWRHIQIFYKGHPLGRDFPVTLQSGETVQFYFAISQNNLRAPDQLVIRVNTPLYEYTPEYAELLAMIGGNGLFGFRDDGATTQGYHTWRISDTLLMNWECWRDNSCLFCCGDNFLTIRNSGNLPITITDLEIGFYPEQQFMVQWQGQEPPYFDDMGRVWRPDGWCTEKLYISEPYNGVFGDLPEAECGYVPTTTIPTTSLTTTSLLTTSTTIYPTTTTYSPTTTYPTTTTIPTKEPPITHLHLGLLVLIIGITIVILKASNKF